MSGRHDERDAQARQLAGWLVERIVATAPGSAEWERLLEEHASRFSRDQIVSQAMLARTLKSARTDPEAFERLQRWCEAAGRRTSPEGIEQRLLAAGSDDEIRALLATVPKMVTPFAVKDSIRQTEEMLRAPSPMPLAMRFDLVERILRVARVTAEMLPDDRLIAEVRYARTRLPLIQGDFEAALPELRACAALFEKLDDALRVAQCIGTAGTLELRLGRLNEADATLRASLDGLGEGEPFDAIRAPTYEELAQIATRREDLAAAGKWYARASELRASLGHQPMAAQDAVSAITPLALCEDYDAAHAAATRFLALRAHLPDEPGLRSLAGLAAESVARLLVGVVARTIRRSQPPLPGADVFAPEAGDDAGSGEVVLDPRWLGEADRWSAVGMDLLQTMPDDRARAVVLLSHGVVRARTGRLEEARPSLSEALALTRSGSDDDLFCATLIELIETETLAGRFGEAAALAVSNLDEAAARGNASVDAQVLLQCAGALTRAGRIREALDPLLRVRAVLADDESPATGYLRGSAAAARSAFHTYLRDAEGATDAALEALGIARAIGYRRGEASELAQLARICGMLAEGRFAGQPDTLGPPLLSRIRDTVDAPAPTGEASSPGATGVVGEGRALGRDLLGRAINVFREVRDHAGEAQAWGNLSNLQRHEDPHAALESLQRALEMTTAHGTPYSRAVVLANLGKLYARIGVWDAALAHLTEALRLAETAEHHEWAYDTAYEIGSLYATAGDSERAESYLRQSIRLLDLARLQLPASDVVRVGFAGDKQAPSAALVALLAALGRDTDAFEAVQQAKSRTLVELVGLSRAAPSGPVQSAEHRRLLDEEGALLARVRARAVEAPLASGDDAASLAALHARLAEIYARLRPLDPEYVDLRQGTPADVGDLVESLADQDRDVVLVDYFVQPTSLLVFVLRSGWRQPVCERVEVDASALADAHAEFQQQVVRLRGRGPSTWQRVAEWLLEPVARHLDGADIVYLSPHGPLHGLPVHALPLAGRALLEHCEVAYLPASGVLPLCQAPGKGSAGLATCCAVGVAFEEEARRVADLFPGCEPLLGGATVDALRTAVRDRDVCHFSCHGHFDPDQPRTSGLVVRSSPAGATSSVLTVDDIASLDLSAEVVFLSACQSGVARVVQGDEQIGILRTFLFAGASSVISTLWPIDAEASEAFAMAFYEHLLAQQRSGRTPLGKAEALRAASKAMIERYGEDDVFRWAPFFLAGNWRSAEPRTSRAKTR